jgi:putative autotransporter adhesin-like protein
MNVLSRLSLVLLGLLTLAAAPALAETLTGSGKLVTESRPVAGFNALSFSVPGKVELTQGSTESLSITADDNVLPYIETFIDQGTRLNVRFRKPVDGHLNVNRVNISITLTARNVEAIALAGSGDIVSGPLKSERLVFNIGGSGNMDIASVEAGDVSVSIGGSGDLAIGAGRTNTLNVRIGGSGEMKAAKLESRAAKVRIGGSGNASLWARNTLDVTVGGSGTVRYYGDPQVDRRVAGSGDVRRLGASPS